MDPVLVIGGCGGFGYHIVKQLLDQDSARTIAAFDISKSDEQLFIRVKIHGTRVLLDEIEAIQCVHALVYTSSFSVVHNNLTNLVNATEHMPKCHLREQTDFYTHTKAVAEDMVLSANRKSSVLTTTIRGDTLFGEGDQTTIPHMVANARSGRSRMQDCDGRNLWDIIYLGNAAHGQLLAA